MRNIVAALLVSISISGASAQQAPRDKDAQNTTGRTVIPEKIGKPLKQGLSSTDVKLSIDEPLNLRLAPRMVPPPSTRSQ